MKIRKKCLLSKKVIINKGMQQKNELEEVIKVSYTFSKKDEENKKWN